MAWLSILGLDMLWLSVICDPRVVPAVTSVNTNIANSSPILNNNNNNNTTESNNGAVTTTTTNISTRGGGGITKGRRKSTMISPKISKIDISPKISKIDISPKISKIDISSSLSKQQQQSPLLLSQPINESSLKKTTSTITPTELIINQYQNNLQDQQYSNGSDLLMTPITTPITPVSLPNNNGPTSTSTTPLLANDSIVNNKSIVSNNHNSSTFTSNRNSESLLLSISDEVFYNICKRLPPNDLFVLASVCKKFKRLLSFGDSNNKVVQETWMISRQRFLKYLQMPPPVGMNEASYIILRQLDKGCQFCHERGFVRIYWEFRVRCCSFCLDKKTLRHDQLYINYLIPNEVLDVLPFINYGASQIYWTDEVFSTYERYKTIVCIDELQKWLEARLQRTLDIMETVPYYEHEELCEQMARIEQQYHYAMLNNNSHKLSLECGNGGGGLINDQSMHHLNYPNYMNMVTDLSSDNNSSIPTPTITPVSTPLTTPSPNPMMMHFTANNITNFTINPHQIHHTNPTQTPNPNPAATAPQNSVIVPSQLESHCYNQRQSQNNVSATTTPNAILESKKQLIFNQYYSSAPYPYYNNNHQHRNNQFITNPSPSLHRQHHLHLQHQLHLQNQNQHQYNNKQTEEERSSSSSLLAATRVVNNDQQQQRYFLPSSSTTTNSTLPYNIVDQQLAMNNSSQYSSACNIAV
ncbi:21061_t:CDS:2 [Entrophospora sp. SA101]|nr:20355_t:CDS:2 [Entrophospora sp. SA101]CAJ0859189.1 21061_t:CDS:2 [Entrophospora sp. SA101]